MAVRLIPRNEGFDPARLEVYGPDGALWAWIEAELRPLPVKKAGDQIVQQIDLKTVMGKVPDNVVVTLDDEKPELKESAKVSVSIDGKLVSVVLAVIGHEDGMDYSWVQWEVILGKDN